MNDTIQVGIEHMEYCKETDSFRITKVKRLTKNQKRDLQNTKNWLENCVNNSYDFMKQLENK